MKVGDLVEWSGKSEWRAIDKAGRIGVVTDMMRLFAASRKPRCRVLFPAPAGEMVVHQSVLKVLS